VQRILLVMAVALVMAAMVVAMAMPAFAKIETVVLDEFCENPSGAQPPGQQDECQGQAQEEVVVTENQNPSGHAPPGHNP
jgi:hypothetical protein